VATESASPRLDQANGPDSRTRTQAPRACRARIGLIRIGSWREHVAPGHQVTPGLTGHCLTRDQTVIKRSTSVIEVDHLTKRYGPVTAVSDVSFTVNKGEILGFLGPNGAGKTTTMRVLTGYMPATEGRCVVAGYDVFEQ